MGLILNKSEKGIIKYKRESIACIICGSISFLICYPPGINLVLGIIALILGLHQLHVMHVKNRRAPDFLLNVIGSVTGSLGIFIFMVQVYLGAAYKFFRFIIQGIR